MIGSATIITVILLVPVIFPISSAPSFLVGSLLLAILGWGIFDFVVHRPVEVEALAIHDQEIVARYYGINDPDILSSEDLARVSFLGRKAILHSEDGSERKIWLPDNLLILFKESLQELNSEDE